MGHAGAWAFQFRKHGVWARIAVQAQAGPQAQHSPRHSTARGIAWPGTPHSPRHGTAPGRTRHQAEHGTAPGTAQPRQCDHLRRHQSLRVLVFEAFLLLLHQLHPLQMTAAAVLQKIAPAKRQSDLRTGTPLNPWSGPRACPCKHPSGAQALAALREAPLLHTLTLALWCNSLGASGAQALAALKEAHTHDDWRMRLPQPQPEVRVRGVTYIRSFCSSLCCRSYSSAFFRSTRCPSTRLHNA